MLIRYVIARPELPKEPRRTMKGISHAKAQDTTARAYNVACEAEGIEADYETLDHLANRDLGAWAVGFDMFSGEARRRAALDDAIASTALMRLSTTAPARNPWNCDRCDWQAHCGGDPALDHLEAWMGCGKGKPAGSLAVEMKSTGSFRKLDRSKPGSVVSPSELRSFATCPRKWKLEYVDRLRPTDRNWARMGARIRGVVTHAFFEAMLNEWRGDHRVEFSASWLWREPIAERSVDIAARYIEAITPTLGRCFGDLDPNDTEGRAELRASISGCAKAANDAAMIALRDVDEIIAVEKTNAIKLPGVNRWVFGTADAVARKGDKLILIELKTTASKQLDAMAERYRTNPAVDLYAAMIISGRDARRGK